MKRVVIFIVVLSCVVSCFKGAEESGKDQRREIVFAAGMTDYRTKAKDAAFEESDAIGLSVLDPVNANNVKLVISGTRAIPEKKLYWGNNQADTQESEFEAYYPYAPECDYVTGFEFYVRADQSSPAYFAASDFMAAHTSAAPGDGLVRLHFTHTLSKLVLVIDNQLSEEIADVFIGDVHGRAYVQAGQKPEVLGKKGTIKAGKVSLPGGEDAYVLVIVPQETALKLMITTVSGKQYTFETTGATVFKSGKRYLSAVMLNEGTHATDLTVDVTDWVDNSDTQFGDEDIPTPPEKIIIEFADEAFKQACLAEGIDTDGDGEISVAEAERVYQLDLDARNLYSLEDIVHFPKLLTLYCQNNYLTEIDISSLKTLTSLYCSYNNLTQIIFPDESALQTLSCSWNQFSTLDVSGLSELRTLYCMGNKLTTLDLSRLSQLITLDCGSNQLVELDLTGNENLSYLNCSNNNLRWLQLMGRTPKLSTLDCHANMLKFIDLYDDRGYWTLGDAILGSQKIRNGEEPFLYDGLTYICLNAGRQLNGVTYSRSWTLGDNVQIITENNFFATLPDAIFFDGNSNEQVLSVLAHGGWELINAPDWVTVKPEGPYDLRLSANSNNTGSPRFGTIIVQAEDGRELSVPVSQGKAVSPLPQWDKSFYHRGLIQEFTWDGCNLDPECDAHLASLKEEMGDQVEIVNFPADGRLKCDAGVELKKFYNITKFPTRIIAGIFPYVGITSFETDKGNLQHQESIKGTHSGMEIESVLSGRDVEVNLTLYTKEADTYLVTGLLLEDCIVSPQLGAGDGYVHNNVAVEQLTTVYGFPVYAEAPNQIRSFAFRYPIPEGRNPENMRAVFYVRRNPGYGTTITNGVYNYGFYADNVLSCPLDGRFPLRYATETMNGNEDLDEGEPIVW